MIVVYPENVWYAGVQAEDLHEILESHLLIGGKPVERLIYAREPGGCKVRRQEELDAARRSAMRWTTSLIPRSARIPPTPRRSATS